MKTISDQLYGYRSEMGATSESNGTKCFCVDNGFTYVAFNGAWFCQSVPWCTRDPGENDLGGYSYYLPDASSVNDLVMFCAYDSGARYIAYNGHWYRQPIPWAEAPSGGGGSDLPAVTSDDNGDVLTVVEGAWAKAAPSGGSSDIFVIHTDEYDVTVETAQEIYNAFLAGKAVIVPLSYYTNMLCEEVDPGGVPVYRLTVEGIDPPSEQSGTAATMFRLKYDVPVSEAEESGFDLSASSGEAYWTIAVTPDV